MNIIFQNSIFGFQPLILRGVPIFQADLTHFFQKQQIEPETFRKKKVTLSDVLYNLYYILPAFGVSFFDGKIFSRISTEPIYSAMCGLESESPGSTRNWGQTHWGQPN